MGCGCRFATFDRLDPRQWILGWPWRRPSCDRRGSNQICLKSRCKMHDNAEVYAPACGGRKACSERREGSEETSSHHLTTPVASVHFDLGN